MEKSKSILHNAKWGSVHFFRNRDISTIQTKDFLAYINSVRERQSGFSATTINHISTPFRRVMKVAQSEGIILDVPSTPRIVKRKDNPRPYFRFSDGNNEYQRLLDEAEKMADEEVVVRGVKVTAELRDFILFVRTHSFVQRKVRFIHCDTKTLRLPKMNLSGLFWQFAKEKLIPHINYNACSSVGL